MTNERILLIEDEPDIAEVLQYNLEKEGFAVETARRGDSGIEAIRREAPDLILLDLMLPGMDGLELTRLLKRDGATSRVPIVMLTARGEEIDRIVGLELGADDYITKPFSPREVVLRVKAVLRRLQPEPAPADNGDRADHTRETELLEVGGIQLDVAGHQLRIRGTEIPLTATEFRLLRLLMERSGRVQTRGQLLTDVWGYAEDIDSRTVDTHIRRLRRKLGSEADRIETVIGVGYQSEALAPVRLVGFTPKLRLAPLWPALAAVLAAAGLLWVLLPGLFEESASLQLLDTLEILSPVVRQQIDAGAPDLQGWVRALAGEGSLRITLIAADGTVLADSARTVEGVRQMENHATRPEVQAALGSGRGAAVRRSATTGRTYVYAARTLTASGGRLFVLRLAQPLSQLATLQGSLAAAMLLALVAAGLVGLVLSLWLDRLLFRPLAGLIQGAATLAGGSYDYRFALPDADELADLAIALNRLAATVQRSFAALRHERDHLQAILSGMSEGVLVVDGAGRALLANPAFFRLFDLAGEVTGRPMLELVRAPELERLVDATLSRGAPQHAALELGGLDRRTIEIASTVLREEGDGRPGAVVVARDTTEFTRLMEMRRDFVANVSHELKTPLSAIRGYAETLRDGALTEPATAARFTERILRQCRRLQALLDDLLTLSRLESLERTPPHEPVDLRALVHRAVDLMSSAAEEKRVALALEDPARPAGPGGRRPLLPPVLGDAEGLERLVVNLLDNAVKYNRPGGEVKVRLAEEDGSALLEVEDTGIGIPQEALPRIFERFYRVDKGRAREEGGTGLGLAIVKHVVQAHGGQIEVKSRMGKGSTFRVQLPLRGWGG